MGDSSLTSYVLEDEAGLVMCDSEGNALGEKES